MRIDPEIKKEIDKDHQDLFLKSPLGPKVLGKMLDDTFFMCIADDESLQRAQDEMKRILAKTGIGVGLTGEQYVRALMTKMLVIEDADGNDGE